MNKDYKKLYEDALERARDLHDNHPFGQPQTWSTCEKIFPVLKESEDEKIRKALIQYFEKVELHYMNRDEILAWLEKQSNIPHFTYDDILALQCAMKTTEKADNELYEQLTSLHDRIHDAYWLEKQGEQKPTWSEEDENMLKSLKTLLNEASCYSCTEGVDKILSWLKSLNPQNRWKPSEKQLEALWDIIPHIPNSEKDIDTITELSALYEELKKL